MESFQENYKKYFSDSARNLQIADHMAYLTYPMINEKRILLKIFDEIFKSLSNCIRGILIFESRFKEIGISSDDLTNFETFVNKFSLVYGFSESKVRSLREIFETGKKHSESAMEFVRREKIVILSDDLGTLALDIVKIKEYLRLAKELLMRANSRVNEKDDVR